MQKALAIVFIVTGLLVLILTSWYHDISAWVVVPLFVAFMVCTYGVVITRSGPTQPPLKLAVSVLIACVVLSVVLMMVTQFLWMLSLIPEYNAYDAHQVIR